tara:strand:+ start:84 stop:401 length:318 start_codon:yes stop_codon:yes gene_type:complete
MTDTSGIIDIVGAQESSDFLSAVVHLVGYSARRKIEGKSLRLDLPDPIRDQLKSVIPAESSKASISPAPHHRERDTTEFSKIFSRKFNERIHLIKMLGVKCPHRV